MFFYTVKTILFELKLFFNQPKVSKIFSTLFKWIQGHFIKWINLKKQKYLKEI